MAKTLFSVLVLLVLNCYVYSASDSCSQEGDVRKKVEVNFRICPGCESGPLQICQDNVWTNLCDRDWTAADAAVACRSLGLSPNDAVNITLSGGSGNPSRTGVVCTGTESHLRDCLKGDSDTSSSSSSGLTCDSGSRVACYPAATEPTSSGSPATGSMDVASTSSSELEKLQSTAPVNTDGTASSTHFSTTADIESEQNFLSGSGLYIFIGGVGAIVVGIMVLVQILLTCWCCLRYRTKVISPYDAEEAQGSTGNEDHLDGSCKTPTTSANKRSKNHHQLQQSPPKATNPIYYSVQDGRHPPREPSGVYAELDNSKVYAQVEPFILSPGSSETEPTYQSVQGDPAYQVLQHKSSLISKNPRKPRHLDQKLNDTTRELPQGQVPMVDFSQHQPKLVSPGSELIRQYATLEEGESEGLERNPGPSMYHTLETPEDNVYHTIEPPPDYATLENPNEPTARENKKQTLGKKDSVESRATPPVIPSRDRTPSKSSISIPRDVGSRSSLSSSSSSQSQQGNNSRSESTPLMSQVGHHPDRSTNSTPPQLSVVNHAPRVTNKYTESPVPNRKEMIIQQQETQKIPIPEPVDTSKMYTLV